MALFKYVAVDHKREDFTESGTIIARDEKEAEKKLKALAFSKVKLKKVTGFSAFIKKFAADVR